MIKLFKSTFYSVVILFFLFLSSCNSDDVTPVIPIDDVTPVIPIGSEGYFIVNEGGFGNGNTSLSFFNREQGTISNNVFETANGIPLGDQAQSMTIHDKRGFVVVQNSAKIEVIDPNDFKIISTISNDIVSPRYFIGLSSTKGYVSDWGADGVSGTVKVINLTTYKVVKTIATGKGTNRLLLDGTSLYAVNAGGWGRDNTIKVIDTKTDEIIQTITVADNPNSLQLDANGDIWIATSGHTEYDADFNKIEAESTPGALIKLDGSGNEILRLEFDELNSATHLNINNEGNQLYYLSSGIVYTLSISATTLPTTAFIDKGFYGLAVDPIDGTIIGCEAPNFSSAGNILLYSAQGTLQNTHSVGIGPNGCTFK